MRKLSERQTWMETSEILAIAFIVLLFLLAFYGAHRIFKEK